MIRPTMQSTIDALHVQSNPILQSVHVRHFPPQNVAVAFFNQVRAYDDDDDDPLFTLTIPLKLPVSPFPSLAKLTHLLPSLTHTHSLSQAPLPSAIASLCLAVFAFLLMAFLFPGAGGSATSIGVAAPEGLLLPSSKWPSPVACGISVSTIVYHLG